MNQTKQFSAAEKLRVRAVTNQAVKDGRIVKPLLCKRCRKYVPLEKHHPDYSDPYRVDWLCPKCHASLYHHPGYSQISMLGEIILDRNEGFKSSLAKAIGMSRHGLWMWMACGFPPSVIKFVSLAGAMQITPLYLRENPNMILTLGGCASLGQRVGLERSTLYKWSKGKIPASVNRAMLLADHLGVCLEELVEASCQ